MAKAKKIIGELSVTTHGYGFVKVDDDEDDIFIPKEKMGGAIHTDIVEVEIQKGDRGEIIRVIKRTIQNIVGTIMKSKHGAFVIPDDERLGTGFNVVGEITSSLVHQKVVARLVGDHTAKIIEILGDGVGTDITGIIRSYNLYEDFPKEVEDEAARVAVIPSEKEIAKRLDLRKKFTITIDPVDARDLDDAISLERCADGFWELGVHIADVSHYVREGSILDTHALARATSVYFPDRVIPMLPRKLSNDVCSLNPNVDRLALSIIMTIDPKGNVLKSQLHETIINVNQRFSYDNVTQDKKLKPWLDEAIKLTSELEKARQSRGEVIFEVPEPKIILCEETGKIKDVIAYPHLISHRIIESFMILANETVAKKIHDLELPFIYRTHEKPDPLKIEQLVHTLTPFKVEHRLTPGGASGFDYQHMLSKLAPELKPIIGGLALRSMQKAKYMERNIGHFGLGSSHYCHFTSPIRRYPDLVIHRIIKMMLNRELSEPKLEHLHEFCKTAAEHSTKMEIMATEAEREVENLKRAEFMSDKIGESFSGTISGIKDFGVFVYLPNTVEGLVRIENMPSDTYRFDAKHQVLVGKRRTYKTGDALDVIVSAVNLPRRQVEFSAQL